MTANISNSFISRKDIRSSCVWKCFARLRDAAGIYPGKDRLCVQCSCICTADAKHILEFECQEGATERHKFMSKMSSVWPMHNQIEKQRYTYV